MSDWVPPIPSQPPPPHPSGQYNQSQGYAGQSEGYNAAQYGAQQQEQVPINSTHHQTLQILKTIIRTGEGMEDTTKVGETIIIIKFKS